MKWKSKARSAAYLNVVKEKEYLSLAILPEFRILYFHFVK